MTLRKALFLPSLLALLALFPSLSIAQGDNTLSLGLAPGASVSALAVRLSDGKVIAQYDADRRLVPASVTKTFTTAAALRILGPDARIATKFGISQDRRSLFVHGAFDPSVGSQYFKRNSIDNIAANLAKDLLSIGVDSLDLLSIDTSLTPESEYNGCRLWEDMGSFFGATPSVVMDRDNELSLYFNAPKGVGQPCRLDSVVPNICGRLPRTAVTTYNGYADHCLVYLLDTTYWLAAGQIPQNRKAFRVKVAAPTPELNYANHLALQLAKRGVHVAKVNKDACPPPDSTIFTSFSPTITEIARQTNIHSVNLFADALALYLSTNNATTRASWDDAANAVVSFWEKQLNIHPNLRDGSGLAPQNDVTATDVVAMLQDMRSSSVWNQFQQSLPRMGIEGTWANIGRQTPLAGRVRAKSGSMTGVIAFAGYMTLADGEEVAFCVITNHNSESSSIVKNKIVNWLLKIYNTSTK